MSKSTAAKVAREINNTIVMHPRFQKAYDGILRIIDTASLAEIPFGATVSAPSGCGKTSLMKSIQRGIPSSTLLHDGVSSLCVAAEANTSIGHLVSKLLRQLGYPTAIRASTLHEQSALVSSAIRERAVKAIFIDECQHIFRGKRTLSAAAITDWIKQLADEAGVVVVMFRTRELGPLEQANEQLSSRAPAHFELREFDLNEEWVGLLRQISNGVTAIDISSIHTDSYKLLHKATRGALRPLKQLLIAGSVHAALVGKRSLDRESLAAGYAQVFGADPHRPNVFEDE
jgi:hypothetical protein